MECKTGFAALRGASGAHDVISTRGASRRVVRGLLCAAVLAAAAAGTASAQGELKIWEVWGNGNPGTATLVRGPAGTVVLCDSGQTLRFAREIDNLLDDVGIDRIDYVVTSHYDNDHCGALGDLAALMNGVESFGAFYDRGGSMQADGGTPGFLSDEYLPLVRSKAGARLTPDLENEESIDLGDGARLTFLTMGAPDRGRRIHLYGGGSIDARQAENNMSITVLLTYGGFDMYIGGDAEGENEMAAAGVIKNTLGRNVDVFRADHHGAKTEESNSLAFLLEIDPEVAVISCWDNGNAHPTRETVAGLHEVVETGDGRQTILRTAPGDLPECAPENMFPECHTTNSTILITTDGASYTVSGGGIDDPALAGHAVDDEARMNLPPEFDPVGDQAAREGVRFTLALAATDPDGDAVTFSSPQLPAGATLDAEAGIFRWTPTHSQGRAVPYEVWFVADDGRGGRGDVAVRISVADVNRAPSFPSVKPGGTVAPNTIMKGYVTATDPDGDPLVYYAKNLPFGATYSAKGYFSWVPSPAQGRPAPYVFTLVALDGRGGMATMSVSVTVRYIPQIRPLIR